VDNIKMDVNGNHIEVVNLIHLFYNRGKSSDSIKVGGHLGYLRNYKFINNSAVCRLYNFWGYLFTNNRQIFIKRYVM
jgi:hypothetical protein